MKLDQLPLMLISRNGVTCSWDPSWAGPGSEDVLLSPTKLLASCPEPIPKKLAVVIEDELLTPQKIEKDNSIKANELEPWLLFKMKRFLRMASDQAQLQTVALPQHWLSFVLPRNWAAQLSQGFAEKQSQCGVIGGFSDFIAQRPQTMFLAIFDDYWLQIITDKNLDILHYQFRRLPLLPNDALDLATFTKVDGARAASFQDAEKVELWFFSDRWDSIKDDLVRHLGACFGNLQLQTTTGRKIDRLSQAGELS